MYIVMMKLLFMYIVIKIKLLRVKGQLSPNGMAWLAWPVATCLVRVVWYILDIHTEVFTQISKFFIQYRLLLFSWVYQVIINNFRHHGIWWEISLVYYIFTHLRLMKYLRTTHEISRHIHIMYNIPSELVIILEVIPGGWVYTHTVPTLFC